MTKRVIQSLKYQLLSHFQTSHFTRQISELASIGGLNKKNRNCKLSAKFNFIPILKILWENIEKCKSLRLFDQVNFSITAYKNMGNFVHFWQFFALVFTIYISINIKL